MSEEEEITCQISPYVPSKDNLSMILSHCNYLMKNKMEFVEKLQNVHCLKSDGIILGAVGIAPFEEIKKFLKKKIKTKIGNELRGSSLAFIEILGNIPLRDVLTLYKNLDVSEVDHLIILSKIQKFNEEDFEKIKKKFPELEIMGKIPKRPEQIFLVNYENFKINEEYCGFVLSKEEWGEFILKFVQEIK